jgi:hypothetical protein
VTCATTGRGGRPHLMPLWYVVEKTRALPPGRTASRRRSGTSRPKPRPRSRSRPVATSTPSCATPCWSAMSRSSATGPGYRLSGWRWPGATTASHPARSFRPTRRLRLETAAQAGRVALHPHPRGDLGPPEARRRLPTRPGTPRHPPEASPARVQPVACRRMARRRRGIPGCAMERWAEERRRRPSPPAAPRGPR